MNFDFDKISKQVKENGFFLLENFLSNEDLNKVKKNLNITNDKEDKKSKLKFRSKDFLKDIINFDFNNIKKKIYLKKLNKKYKLDEIAAQILGSNINYTADFYLSKISNNMVFPWHTDQAFTGRKDVTKFEINQNRYLDPEKAALKFFFYLTDVDSENGCLAYIPKSNIISFYLKKLILDNKIDYSPFWLLSDYRNLILKKEVRLLLEKFIEKKVIDEFYSNTLFINEKEGDTRVFDLPCKAGSLLIFSELGVHRASAVKNHERKVLRYFYKRNNIK